MKKLLLLSLLITFSIQAQIVNIPDANLKAKLLQANTLNTIASTQDPDANGVVTSYTSIDTNGDGEIQVSEAQAIKYLNVKTSNCIDIFGIENFINLKYLDCSNNQLTNINATGLNNLQFLKCFNNELTTLNISGLTNLLHLNCLLNQLSSLDISGLTNLQYLNYGSNNLINLDLSNLINLKYLNCSINQISSLSISNLTNLEYLSCCGNPLSNLNVTSLINLQKLECFDNQLTSLNVSNLTNLEYLNCCNNQIPSLLVNGLTNLEYLDCSNNQLPNLLVSNLTNLQYLSCSNNQIPSLLVNGLTNLQKLYCSDNQISSLNVNNLLNLLELNCSNNLISNLDVSNLTNLERLFCASNQLSTLNVSTLIYLKFLNFSSNELTSIDVNNLSNLTDFSCAGNQLTNLTINDLTNLKYLNCSNNYLTNLSLNNLTNLLHLRCTNNELTSLNTNSLPKLMLLQCSNNQLISLYLKNNTTFSLHEFTFENNPTLQFLCCDDGEINHFQTKVNSYGYGATCQVNSYCNFTPGGAFYILNGTNKLDQNNNGCDSSDSNFPNLKFEIVKGTITRSYITNNSGNYNMSFLSGLNIITPQIENPNYFTISPESIAITFPTATTPNIQDFCISPNGIHHDLEVFIIPLSAARPGFNTSYKIKYKNKGTVTENATLVFNYNDAVLDLVSTSLVPNSQSTGNLSWNIGTINPFQTGEILVTLNLNSPTETPPVNAGDVLNFSAVITGLNTDETPIDNTFSLNQLVLNSYDPNDKTCLEGSSINPNKIGEYVHYLIRFENTGTFPAQNIVVKDMIDTTKFDIATLQMTDASHNCITRISNPDKVEFIFENINLPFDNASNDGYIAFKIKTKNTLVVGNSISNMANIYFDYNFPIETNTATSIFEVLQNDSFEFDSYFTIYPNPTLDVINLKVKQNVSIHSVSIYSVLGQLVQTITSPDQTIDVSQLQSGNYFIKVVTDKGISNSKFVKQ